MESGASKGASKGLKVHEAPLRDPLRSVVMKSRDDAVTSRNGGHVHHALEEMKSLKEHWRSGAPNAQFLNMVGTSQQRLQFSVKTTSEDPEFAFHHHPANWKVFSLDEVFEAFGDSSSKSTS